MKAITVVPKKAGTAQLMEVSEPEIHEGSFPKDSCCYC